MGLIEDMERMLLSDTVEMMNSSEYKERFKAEYYQLKIRLSKLESMVEKWDKGELDFTPTCHRELYDVQMDAMRKYLDVLDERAKLEEVDLEI